MRTSPKVWCPNQRPNETDEIDTENKTLGLRSDQSWVHHNPIEFITPGCKPIARECAGFAQRSSEPLDQVRFLDG